MSVLSCDNDCQMFAAVSQAEQALGYSFQRGLGKNMESIECLSCQNWNKLEIPEALNGGGVVVVITAEQGGFLIFLPDDGVLLPLDYASTLTDPTEPLPSMAVELQKNLIPDSPGYYGKRIGKAKVFSSMVRRAGVKESTQILPVKLHFGGFDSQIWFVGDVPHPERAFAKRNPALEQRSKKVKLFSDEILSEFHTRIDFPSSTIESVDSTDSELFSTDSEKYVSDELQSRPETGEILSESASPHGEKPTRRFANLSGLLALKQKNQDILDISDKNTVRAVETVSVSDYNHTINTKSLLESEEAAPALAVHEALIQPAESEKEPICVLPPEPMPIVPDSIPMEIKTISAAESLLKTLTQVNCEPETSPSAVSAVPAAEAAVPLCSEPAEEFPQEIQAAAEQTAALPLAFSEESTIKQQLIENNPLLKLPVRLEALVTRRAFTLQDILRWKPGDIIEFAPIEPVLELGIKTAVLAKGRVVQTPEKNNVLQLE